MKNEHSPFVTGNAFPLLVQWVSKIDGKPIGELKDEYAIQDVKLMGGSLDATDVMPLGGHRVISAAGLVSGQVCCER